MTIQTDKPKTKSFSPWFYVPSLYFAQGIPYMVINALSVVFYDDLGVSDAEIAAWTSLINLPWVIKMFWGPVVDIYSTKRRWLLAMQGTMFFCLGLLAFSLQLENFFYISLAILAAGAFVSATYDIATDGYYMLALSTEQQAFFVGIRAFCYRMAMIFTTGALPIIAGTLQQNTNNFRLSWSITLGSAAVIFALLFIFHNIFLPAPEAINKSSEENTTNKIPFVEVVRSYVSQRRIVAVLAFILLYRLGEAMLLKMATLFLKADVAEGGFGLSNTQYGLVYGTFGYVSLIIGGILGGLIISKYGLRKCLLPMALALNLPDIFYVYMAYAKPPLEFVYPLVSLEQFGYGLGTTAFMVYLIHICKGEYKTSHFAISTGLMAFGLMLPGAISGVIKDAVGYPLFFVIVCLLTLPGMATIFFIPIDEEVKSKTS